MKCFFCPVFFCSSKFSSHRQTKLLLLFLFSPIVTTMADTLSTTSLLSLGFFFSSRKKKKEQTVTIEANKKGFDFIRSCHEDRFPSKCNRCSFFFFFSLASQQRNKQTDDVLAIVVHGSTTKVKREEENITMKLPRNSFRRWLPATPREKNEREKNERIHVAL